MSGKQVQKWADEFMFTSEKHNAAIGPIVHLLSAGNDPLGQIAAAAKMYMGEVVRDMATDVTDEERRHYAEEMMKTKLKMPLETVSLHFMLENVTRAFTHQLVRQRTAAYAQESMRFAVVEDMNEAVALPPSLVKFNDPTIRHESLKAKVRGMNPRDDAEQQFWIWTDTVAAITHGYGTLVELGMPAEEARGLMPTNIITRVNYITNLRGLLDHAGNRLCTQAQFEWRIVFAQIAQALRTYGQTATYEVEMFMDDQPGDVVISERTDKDGHMWRRVRRSAAWQFEVIASILKPVCYQTGSCAFKADFDRKCSIRERVDANASINRPSSEWGENYSVGDPHKSEAMQVGENTWVDEKSRLVFIGAIQPREWLMDHAAAR